MVVYKEYTNGQYKKFLSHKMGANFGISEQTFLDKFMRLPFSAKSPFTTYGVTRKQLEDSYIPLLKSILGGYVWFLLYSYQEGGGAGNWINHYGNDTSSTPYGCMRDDAKYLVNISHRHGSPAMSAPEVFNWTPYTEDTPGETAKTLNSMGNGTIGRAYMQSTMAGNAWVFGTKWCEANQGSAPPYVYFGNPYDGIIDLIKKMGGDPFGDNDTDSSPKGDSHPKNPQSTKPKVVKKNGIHKGYVYLNGSLFATGNDDGIKFTRYGNILFLEPGEQEAVDANTNNGGDAKESGKEADKTPTDKKWEKIKKEIDRIKNSHGGQYTYANIRPQQNPTVCGWADCSGMVGFVIRNVFPQVWNNGYLHTGTIYQAFKKMGKVVWAGPVSEMPSHYKDVKKGYLIEMAQDMTFGAGLYSHVGIMLGDGGDGIFFNQSGGNPPTQWNTTLKQEVAYVGATHPYWAILKI